MLIKPAGPRVGPPSCGDEVACLLLQFQFPESYVIVIISAHPTVTCCCPREGGVKTNLATTATTGLSEFPVGPWDT